MLSHDNLLASIESILARLALASSDSTVIVLPFVFSYGNSVLLTHLFSGAKIIIEENFAFARCVVESMKKEAATGFSGVAIHYAVLLRDSGFRSTNLPSLRYLTSAGGPMPHALLAKVREAIPNAGFHVMYGQTEATARITMLSPEETERKMGFDSYQVIARN
jgi:long-chain acyl-CoA synthetase